ncbi:uncharacterized protein LOC114519736 [Dendronephthya gigantea]|uniref:uncharacterized protein LOC114519736 n=1 Tax=Dendronephthya gigantea TaxID=151771 RepID=UPI00106CEAB4|nr:uncharacterized protein LOC114519736 [Dendronephthya gigantea]
MASSAGAKHVIAITTATGVAVCFTCFVLHAAGANILSSSKRCRWCACKPRKPKTGGPRKEFFRLILLEIKEKYFDDGLRDLLAEEYITIGMIMISINTGR